MGARDWFTQWQARLRSQASGARGERLAEAWLQRAGYKIVARNWRSARDRRDEIDLVCWQNEVLVFVEVKTRAAAALVSGYYAIDRRKKTALRRAIDDYLRGLAPAQRPQTIRFDVVEVQTEPNTQASLHHFENVPLFAKDYLP